jgi:hypothetical protein
MEHVISDITKLLGEESSQHLRVRSHPWHGRVSDKLACTHRQVHTAPRARSRPRGARLGPGIEWQACAVASSATGSHGQRRTHAACGWVAGSRQGGVDRSALRGAQGAHTLSWKGGEDGRGGGWTMMKLHRAMQLRPQAVLVLKQLRTDGAPHTPDTKS